MPGFGLFEAADQIENNEAYYLVDADQRQYLVKVSKEYMETVEMTRHMANPYLGDWTLWIALHVFGDFYYLDQVTSVNYI